MIFKLFFLSSFLCSFSFLQGEKAHAVFVVGTHHYSPQKSMPMLASEIERLGFKTTVINPDWDPEKDKRGLPGLEALKKADLAIFYTRFLKIDDQQLLHITDYLKSGKPVVGFRTSTHDLEPEMTDVVAWTWTNKWGGRTFSTSLGHLNDFGDANSVRLIINGIFWASDLAVPSADTKINTFVITSSKKKKK